MTVPLPGPPPAPAEDDHLKVGAGTNAQSLASAIAHAVYAQRRVVLRAVGAGAVNQAVKAVAIARGYVAPNGFDLSMRPGFANVPGQEMAADGSRTTISAITLQVIAG